MILLLDLNYTLVENSDDKRRPFIKQIEAEPISSLAGGVNQAASRHHDDSATCDAPRSNTCEY